MRKFIEWVADYTMSPPGMVLKMAMGVPDLFKPKKRARNTLPPQTPNSLDPIPLSTAQQEAANHICTQISKGTFHTTLLDGVTGSGKTEVYFAAIAESLKQNKQSLILLPEIALSVQWLERFKKRFGFTPAVWHSDVTRPQKRDIYKGVTTGEVPLVVGARSALFLPFKVLGLIVVDEEHDGSYKQEDGVIYQARDMAIVRAKMERVPIVLASATPSIETVCNTNEGRYTKLHLPERHGGALYPETTLIDMKDTPKNQWLSDPLRTALTETLNAGHQAMLFLNRRGYAPLTLCRACGHRFQCPHCSAWLVTHQSPPHLQCHHCGYVKALPKACPSCNADDSLVICGPGVERVMEEVQSFLPKARIAQMTSDSITTPKDTEALVHRMESGDIDVLVGTQMMAKGHHFPNLTLVGVVDGDMGLAGGDLRASERTYQLLHQVAGRAGREQNPGRAFLQTYTPNHPVMQALKTYNRDTFYSCEIAARKTANMPPFARLAGIILSGKSESEVQQTANLLAHHAHFDSDHIRILGPAPAPLYYLRGKVRYRLLVHAKRSINLQKALTAWLASVPTPRTVQVRVDIDPYGFM